MCVCLFIYIYTYIKIYIISTCHAFAADLVSVGYQVCENDASLYVAALVRHRAFQTLCVHIDVYVNHIGEVKWDGHLCEMTRAFTWLLSFDIARSKLSDRTKPCRNPAGVEPKP